MGKYKWHIKTICFLAAIIVSLYINAQEVEVVSPGNNIKLKLQNTEVLKYSVIFNGREIVSPSIMGFEFKDEEPLKGNFEIVGQHVVSINEKWNPVVKSKHAEVANNCNELELVVREKAGLMRQLTVIARAYDDGVAFRYKLPRAEKPGDRQITKELTTFAMPANPTAWVVEYGGYASSNESEFIQRPLEYVTDKTIAGMPFLMDCGNNCWMAITEANINNYAAFYIGTNGTRNQLTTKLVPLPGEPENGVKVRFNDEMTTPWRVVMIGQNPGTLIESEIIQNLNEPCAIADPSWIKPGMCAWDNWWSGDVKMEMPVIKKYIDFASEMGWPYMLVDWQWYGPFNTPVADITKWAPQISMPEIISYAKSKNVKIIVWLYSSDVNRNSAYKKAFPLYKSWGVAGIKIDFMDRDDQQMVNWYHDIVKCASENQLMVDFHGAYKPDGFIRTYPNLVTREGVMGEEYCKFSNKISAAHNVKLAYTRMLAGQMDYTPGGFLNVTDAQFKNQVPTIVPNTRAAELSKFVIYESPLTVMCEHPDNVIGQAGADFLKIVHTTWDDIKFLGGTPDSYVALAKRSGNEWFIGVMNNGTRREIEMQLDFLPKGKYEIELWTDTKKSDVDAKDIQIVKKTIDSSKPFKLSLAINGGAVARIKLP